MRRIVIADDDVIVRRYLEQIIRNELPEFELCGIAKNGCEAISLIAEKQPDLAIIDIDMPEKDGVEVLYQLRKEKISPETKVIVLSCYNDFDYVKNAMKYGAVDYILKYKVDTETLAKMLESVFENDPSVKVLEYKKNHFRPSERQDKLLKKILFAHDESVDDKADSAEWAEALNIKTDNLLAAVGVIDYHDKFLLHNTEEDILQLNEEIMSIISENTGDRTNTLAACIDEDKYVLIFSDVSREENSAAKRKIEKILSSIKKEIEEKLQMTVTFGLSGGGGNITNVAAYYENALSALRYKLYMGTNSLIWYEQCTFSEEIPSELKDAINEWSRKPIRSEEAMRQLEDIFQMLGTLRLRYSQYNLLLLRLVGNVIRDAEDSAMMSKVFGDIDTSTVFCGCETWRDHFQWMQKHISRLKEGGREEKHRSEIEAALRYIEDNLGEPLTLSRIADHVNFSKNYFSQLFKQSMGENLVDYIARIRINRAKELLLSSDYKVYEIAAEVGFESQHYFNRLFKTLVGVTPTEYRNIKCFS